MKSNPPGNSLGSSVLLYALMALIAFGRCLTNGLSYFDNDLLAEFGPWRDFLRERIAQGDFPLWNPTHLGGYPFFADLQNTLLYPITWLILPFSTPVGFTLFFMFHMFWAALGSHLWLRSLGLSKNSCRMGALLFASSGFFWMELIHPPVLAAFSWMPWLFLALENLARTARPRDGFFSGLSSALLFLCGSPQVTLGAFYGGAAYFLFRRFSYSRGASFLQSLKPLLLAFLFLVWGSLPLLGQLIPTLELSSLTTRWNPNKHSEQINANLSLKPVSFVQIILPRFGLTGNKTLAEAIQSTDPTENFWSSLGYLGAWVPFLALASLTRRPKGVVFFLWGFSFFALLLCLGVNSPLLPLFRQFIPGFGLIQVPYRYIYLFVLSFGALAVFGWEAWISKPDQRPGKKWLGGALVYAAVLVWAALANPKHNWLEIPVLSFGLLGLWVWGLSVSFRRLGVLIFVASLTLPLFLHGWTLFQPGPASNFNYRQNSSVLVQIAESVRPGRVNFEPFEAFYPIQVDGKKYVVHLPQNAAFAFGLKDFTGYNPLQLVTHKEITSLPQETIFRLGAIRGIITQKNHGTVPGLTLKSFPPYLFYEWNEPLRYVFAPYRQEVHPTRGEMLGQMAKPGFDPYVTAHFTSPIPEQVQNRREWEPARLDYRLDREASDKQFFTVTLDKPSVIVFCERMYPGWKAWVDGKPSPVFTADNTLRSLFLEAGRHQIEFRFEPFWWPAVPLGLLAWLLLTPLLFLNSYLRPAPVHSRKRTGKNA